MLWDQQSAFLSSCYIFDAVRFTQEIKYSASQDRRFNTTWNFTKYILIEKRRLKKGVMIKLKHDSWYKFPRLNWRWTPFVILFKISERKLHVAKQICEHYFNAFFVSSGLQHSQSVLLTHGDSIDRVCDKFKICATSSSNIVAGIYNEQSHIYGVQFHPEVDLTVQGNKMLANFLFNVARLTPNFTMKSRKDECIRYIREKVGNHKVLVSVHSIITPIEGF